MSYGFDGSSNQSIYNQDKVGSENSLFASVIIPLCILHGSNTLWINSNSRSVRYCRPLCLEYTKETKNHVLAVKSSIDEEIKNLGSLVLDLDDDLKVSFKFHMVLSLIDGKVHSYLGGKNINCSFFYP